MSAENYTVAVKLSLVENVSKGLVAMAGQFATLNEAADVFNAKLKSLKSQIAIGGMMVGAGVAIAAPFIYATAQAGKLEQQLKMVQEATHASAIEMDNFNKSILHTATSSMFGVTDVAKMAKTLATAGNFNISQVQNLLPEIVKFAQTQQLLKGTKYDKSAEQAIKIAEITGNFDPSSIDKVLNSLTKLSLLMPGSVDKVLSAFKYSQGTLKNVMGVDPEQNLLLVAFFQRMGMEGTRAGSQLLAAITRSIPGVMGSGLWEGKSPQALREMGLSDFNGKPTFFTNGKFDALKWEKTIGDFVERTFKTMPEAEARQKVMQDFQFAYGTTGSRIASIISSPQAREQLKELQESFKKHPNLEQLTQDTNSLFAKQLPQAMKGIGSVFTELGFAILPSVNSGLTVFNKHMQDIADWVASHQTIVAFFEKAILAVAGLSIAGGIFMLVRAGIMGLLIPIQLLSTILPSLTAAFLSANLPALLIIGSIAAVGFALYENWTTVKEIFHALERTFYYLGDAVYHIIHPIQTLMEALKGIQNYFNSPLPSTSGGKADFLGADLSKPISSTAPGGPDFLGMHWRRPAAIPAQQSKHVQPIHVNVHMDGQKVASAVVNHVVNQASNVPNSSSRFDTSLSPMHPVMNAFGINV